MTACSLYELSRDNLEVIARALLLGFIVIGIGGYMSQTAKQSSEESNQGSSSSTDGHSVVKGFWGVRYQVKDVKRSVDFYTQQLGLKLDMQNLPAFAQVSVGNLKLILSGPGASGSRPMPDGKHQEPGGWMPGVGFLLRTIYC